MAVGRVARIILGNRRLSLKRTGGGRGGSDGGEVVICLREMVAVEVVVGWLSRGHVGWLVEVAGVDHGITGLHH